MVLGELTTNNSLSIWCGILEKYIYECVILHEFLSIEIYRYYLISVLAPTEKMAEMMKKTTKEAKDMISKVNITNQYRVNI